MSNLLTGSQMRAVEEAAIAAGETRGAALMERAGEAVVNEIYDAWPELYGVNAPRVAILAGPGNNGGDGFVVARRLAERGWQVSLALAGERARLGADAARALALWEAIGPVMTPERLSVALQARQAPDLSVDALFGTGLSRPVGQQWAALAALMARSARRSLAVDIVSGLCADSGRVLGPAPHPVDLTVSFHTAKPGHVLDEGGEITGRLVVADIGLDRGRDAERAGGRLVSLVGAADCRAVAVKPVLGHKFLHGHALVLTGGPGCTGAARLAARAALRIGAGLVTLGVPPSAQQEVACQVTALMLQRVGDADALREVLSDPRINALCLGPGLGLEDRARALVALALKAQRPLVLDADALSLFAAAPEELLAATRGRPVVLTPHGGEFARLFPDLARALRSPAEAGPAFSALDAARAAAERAGCVVLLKGAATVIAAPDGTARVHAALGPRAAPWLATAGAGDVLAGLITGLLARGASPFEAASQAAWLHAEAGRRCGPGLIAEDLPEVLPQVLSALGSAV
ncbi:bifunctional ADP-dependent NAD(P)H-hydrate dehydratase/NAD(P)H-hydrate epimerase [Oceanicola sp. S124]|uniref:bifunctional ADP-dependent NAD(P)H-hydrate dehydratase/NAD(P)H-hydrate epimerase n=1 Tax=Oceanicola sp. S124 TaxID=1042378 RepID=UPI0002557967|nr:bifunctional ADP-dependent NAD(P)H-hydrate dehydratase/NAD(P)H-hydrate epimerase [Oceanicola sp. S124]